MTTSPRRLRKHYAHPSVSSPQLYTPSGITTYEEQYRDSVQSILRLLWVGQTMSRQAANVTESLCEEVTNITQGKAQLILQKQETAPSINRTLFSFSVQFGDVTYGTLHIAPDCEQPTIPAIPFVIAQLLAQICSWLLHTFELSIFLQGQCQHLSDPIFVSLTRREREVLTLMCLGHNQQTIAQKLNISPTTVGKHRQHIYEQLGVHNEHDALLAAYHFSLFSILDLPISCAVE